MSQDVLKALGISAHTRVVAEPCREAEGSAFIVSSNPATGLPLAGVRLDSAESYEATVERARDAFVRWREVPAPVRGQVVRAIGEEFRLHRAALGELVSLESGKIRAEGLGEVQEAIDIADFAVGLSRQLPGQVLPSERAGYRLMEQWLPLGPIGVISAFNFPCAVWAWNAMVAAVCGDVIIWKPSLLTPLVALASNAIADRVATSMGHPGVFNLVIGTDEVVGERMIADRRLPLVSATGSCKMGRRVGEVVSKRLGRALLELGGNNAAIVHSDADLDLAIPAIVFAAVGTAGQRCTTTRRLIVHRSIVEQALERLVAAYRQVHTKIGDPLKEGTLVGPLINDRAVDGFARAIAQAQEQGGKVLIGGRVVSVRGAERARFVEPTIIRAPASNQLAIAREETFAPILYVFVYDTIDEALAMNNSVDQGLSSAIFTESLRISERFLAPSGSGSDCGLAYVNAGTSGAEIGGAFGGEKDTGGGRESGSDAWKAYMRRQTCVVNFGGKFELAQGIRFE